MKRKESKIIDLEKKRTEINLKKLIRLLRIPIVILVVLAAVFLSIRLMGNVAVSNITDGLRQVKTLFSASSAYPYSLDNVEINKLDTVASDVVIADDNSVTVLDSKARERFSLQLDSADTKIISENGRALVYGESTSTVTLISKTETLGTVKTEKGVITAALADNGAFAVSNPSEKAQSVLTVYNNRFGVEFRWNCSTERISSIALSDNGKRVALAAVGATNAEIYSRFLIFSTGKSEPIADIKLTDTLIYKIIFTSSNKIIVISDKKTAVYNTKGEVLSELSYSENSVSAVASDSNGNTLLCLDEYGGSKSRLIVFKANGKTSGEIVINGVPENVDISDNRVAVILGNEIIKYSYSGKEIDRYQTLGAVSRVAVTSGSVYTVESGYIRKY